MAVVATTLYSYFDQNLNRRSVLGSGLNDRGNWSSVVTYSPNDVILYDSDLYISIQTSLNVIPSGTVTDGKWSPLVIVYEAPPVQSSGSDSYARDLAAAALNAANLAANTANAAYTLATTGTAAAQTALSVAQSAFALASAGTTTAQAAYTLAAAGTQIGSNAYTLAQAASTMAVNGSATLQLLINGSLTIDRLLLRDQTTHQTVVFIVDNGQFQNP